MPPLLIVDGHNLLYRAWFGFPARICARTSDRDLTGVFGFTALLRKAHREHAADHEVVVVVDSESSAIARQRSDPSYKTNRDGADHAPMGSYADVTKALDATGVRWVERVDAEADDMIAALTAATVDQGRQVMVMSRDKDFYQLLDRAVVRQLDTGRVIDQRVIGASFVRERYRVTPAQWPDFRALMGDPSDGIPGVAGIGPVTAAEVLAGGAGLEQAWSRLSVHHRRPVRSASTLWPDVSRWRDLIRLDASLVPPGGLVTGRPTQLLPPAAAVLDTLHFW